MDALIFLVPLALLMGGFFAAAFLVSVNRGQFDDLDDPPVRMLRDDD
jgi:cbb3-type cytochrome oxidase maturation protein